MEGHRGMNPRRLSISDLLPHMVAGLAATMIASLVAAIGGMIAALHWPLMGTTLIEAAVAGALWGSLGAVLLTWIVISVSPSPTGFVAAVIAICALIWGLVGGGGVFLLVSFIASC